MDGLLRFLGETYCYRTDSVGGRLAVCRPKQLNKSMQCDYPPTWVLGDFLPFGGRIVKLSATLFQNGPHMVFGS